MKKLKRYLHSPWSCFIATIPLTGIYCFPSYRQPAFAKASAGQARIACIKGGQARSTKLFTHLNKLVNC